jgi:hypothetical protein
MRRIMVLLTVAALMAAMMVAMALPAFAGEGELATIRRLVLTASF